MTVGVNAWALDNPVLLNTQRVHLSTYDIVAGDTEVEFGSSLITDLYDNYVVEFDNILGSFTIGFGIILSRNGVYDVAASSYQMYNEDTASLISNIQWELHCELSSNGKRSMNGILNLDRGNITLNNSSCDFDVSFMTGGLVLFMNRGKGTSSVLGNVDGIKLIQGLGEAGTLTSGKIKLFGIPNT